MVRQVAKDAVVVEADAIKNKDVVYQQLNRRLSRMGRSISDLSKYVHEYSTKAAESMFVAAINHQRVRDRPECHEASSLQPMAQSASGFLFAHLNLSGRTYVAITCQHVCSAC